MLSVRKGLVLGEVDSCSFRRMYRRMVLRSAQAFGILIVTPGTSRIALLVPAATPPVLMASGVAANFRSARGAAGATGADGDREV